MARVLDLASAASEPVQRVGGKATGLARLVSLGHAVPPGFVVTTDAQRGWMRDQQVAARVAELAGAGGGYGARVAASEAIDALFAGAELVDDEIDRAYARLGAGADVPVAVRSSATAEDLAGASFAGQQETYLPVIGRDAVRRHVVRCWASLYSPQAIEYRARLGIPADDLAMAVVVQRLVPAEAAGVLFTIDPLSGDRSQITIEACPGLGLPMVGGEVTPDRYSVDKVSFELRSRAIARKPFADRFDAAAGEIRRTALEPAEAAVACLGDDEVVALAALGKRIEQAFGFAMDVEWAIGPGPDGPRQVHLLQARPETVRSNRASEPDANAPRSAMDRIVSSMLGTRP
ncbi:MAG TPA: PEP/pyruvate-binding domain-containing protein [Solirubrobacteraceae bacterium]